MADANRECNNNIPPAESPEPVAWGEDHIQDPNDKMYVKVFCDGVWKIKLVQCGGYVQLSDRDSGAPMVPLSELLDMQRATGDELVKFLFD